MNKMNRDKTFMSLAKELNKSYPTMRRYVDDNSYPADVCLEVERLTQGDLKAVVLRPDLFKPNHAQVQLANSFLDNYLDNLAENNFDLVISVLNYFEHQCPDLYKDIIKTMCEQPEGKDLIKQRIAHKQNGCN